MIGMELYLIPSPLRGKVGMGVKIAGLDYKARDLTPSYPPPVRGRDVSTELFI
jgi:hypothetical protein